MRVHSCTFFLLSANAPSELVGPIHELDEADCIAFFPVLRQSTIWILERDKKKREELAQQRALEAAIANCSLPAQQ